MEDVKRTLNRALVIDINFAQYVLGKSSFHWEGTHKISPVEAGLTKEDWIALFESQMISRHLDLYARLLKEQGKGFYTIGSSGHEGNAGIAYALSISDIAYLHYRSGAFMVQRAKQGQRLGLDIDPIRCHLLSLIASKFDPISGGRHKVFGHPLLNVPPQTSTIASHLPKALGAAFALKLLPLQKDLTNKIEDKIICCSFGDASFNHSTLQGTLNAISRLRFTKHPVPLLLVCEDNALGISVPTPAGWIKSAMLQRLDIHYLPCDGRNLAEVIYQSRKAVQLARKGEPVFLHFETVRLMGHAGSDIEQQYLDTEQILKQEEDDPLLHTAKITMDLGWMNPTDIVNLYEKVRLQVDKEYQTIVSQGLDKGLSSKEEVMASILPKKGVKSDFNLLPTVSLKNNLKNNLNLVQGINSALFEILNSYPKSYVFGEDVGRKGGVYQVTANLQSHFGHRVMDSILDEQTILGMALGFGQLGLLPIVEIQFLAYLQNAVDQLRGEAATQSFFSNQQYTNPMIIRLPGLAYQKGFGGHFHNENAIGFLREIPGIIVCCPSNSKDAVCLLRECIRMAIEDQRVIVFLEPIALYMTKDLYQEGDKAWLFPYPELTESISWGQLQIYRHPMTSVSVLDADRKNNKVLILSYGNGLYLSLKAAKQLQTKVAIGVDIDVVDLRWLVPLPKKSLLELLQSPVTADTGVNTNLNLTAIRQKYSHILIVDECRQTGSVSEELITFLIENKIEAKSNRITAEDCFIPLGDAWQYILPSVEDIVDGVIALTLS